MDDLDVRIFCEMAFKYVDYNRFSDRRVSPTEIGKKFGLDEKTVRLRVKKMEDEGFIKYYQAIPNLSLFGLPEICSCMFGVPNISSKLGAIDRFRKASFVVEIDDFMGPAFGVAFACASAGAARKMAEERAQEVELTLYPNMIERRIGAPQIQPNKLDWQIIRELRYDALRPTKEIAEALSITYRMAEYRISILLDSGVFFVVALINPKRQQGLIFYGLGITVSPERQSTLVSQLKEMYGEKLWFLRVPDRQSIIANLFAFTTGEPEDAQITVSKLQGVNSCFLLVNREHMEPDRPNWIDKSIEAEIEGSANPPATS